MTNRLYRSRTNKVFAGVCGGIGEYFDVDPVLIRLMCLLLTVFTAVAPGVVAYVIAVLIVPEAPGITPSKPAQPTKSEEVHDRTTV